MGKTGVKIYRTFAHSFEPISHTMEEIVEMRLVLVVVKLAHRLAKVTCLSVAIGGEDITSFKQNLDE